MTYGAGYAEWRRHEREHREEQFARLSPTQKQQAWEARIDYLASEYLCNRSTRAELIERCPTCVPGLVLPNLGYWPAWYECLCGIMTVVDRWLPDHVERSFTIPMRLRE